MADSARPLLVLAASARPLAVSARRAGYQVVAIDGFGDLDTRAAAHRWHRVPFEADGFDQPALLSALKPYPKSMLVYGGGLEWSPGVLARLGHAIEVVGNQAETLKFIADAPRFFRQLRECGVPHPPVRQTPPDDGGMWLSKRAAASGGGHVRWRQTGDCPDRARYFQRYAPGVIYSVLFLADRRSFCEVGWNRLLDPDDAPGFDYRGAVNRAPGLGSRARDAVREWIHRLVPTVGLAGLNGLDFVLTEDGPVLIDLNARPPATLSLFDPEYPRGLVHAHVAAVRGKLPPAPRAHPARGHAVVRAPHSLTFPPGFDWPDWCADLPPAGTRLPQAAPVCTVYAVADARRVAACLARRQQRLLASLVRSAAGPQALAS